MLNCINTDFTKYFSWGDIRGDNKNGYGSYSFSSGNYNAGASGSGHTLTGDIPQGNIYYDAATANMGSRWKMPDITQVTELINNTISGWNTLNGVNGYMFISKTDPSNYIFLPAAGSWNTTNNYDKGQRGYYWTIDAVNSSSKRHMMFLNNNSFSNYADYPYCGMSVRAISIFYSIPLAYFSIPITITLAHTLLHSSLNNHSTSSLLSMKKFSTSTAGQLTFFIT